MALNYRNVMTQDFRQSGQGQVSARAPVAMEPGRRMIVLALYASAFAFMLAGVWLLVGEQEFLDTELAPIVGVAFIVTALSDVVAVAVLKKLWSRIGS